MKYVIDHDYHIHSMLSLCSKDPEQNPERLLEYAVSNGLKKICITDHFWDETVAGGSNWYKEQNYAHVSKALPLPQKDGIDFYFGTETELSGDLVLGISRETIEKFDFVIIPTTHLHMSGYTISGDASSAERARAFVSRLDAVLDMELPFSKIGIAHLACALMDPDRDIVKVLSLISDSELESPFKKAAKTGVGIELNASDFDFDNKTPGQIGETVRLFGKAKECGCKFYLGSDAHHPAELDAKAMKCFKTAIDALELTEDDKFRPF